MKKFFVGLFGLSLVVIITLFIAEAILRIFPSIIAPTLLVHFHPEPRKQAARGRFLTYDEVNMYESDDGGPPLHIVKPFTVLHWHDYNAEGDVYTAKVDEIGFCNEPGTYDRTSTIDVVTLGDSFTWCNSVDPDNTWTAQLSRFAGVSAYNLGRGGVGPYEYVQILKGFGLGKKPRFVILAVYEGNDLRDAIRYYTHRTRMRELASVQQDSQAMKGGLLTRYSYVVNLLLATAKHFGSGPAASKSDDIDFRYHLKYPDAEVPFNHDNGDRDEVRHAKRLYAKDLDLQVFKEALNTFVELSRQHKFVPIVIYIPSAHTAYAKTVVYSDPELKVLMPWFSREQRKFFELQGKELGYTFIDMTRPLQAAAAAHGPKELLYYRGNLHLTGRGHKVVAETLGNALQIHDRLEPRTP